MNVDSLLNLFHKYGYYSKDKEPYIYYNDDQIGICYKFRDFFYGELSRIYFPSDLIDAEEFFKMYYWYNKNHKKYNVRLVLDDYKIVSPVIKYVYDGNELTYEDMKNLEKNDSFPTRDLMYLDKIKRTAFILVDILNVKIVTQRDTYNNLYNLTKNYYHLLGDLENKMSLYYKKYVKKEIIEPQKEEIKDYSGVIRKIRESIDKLNTTHDVEKLINKLLEKLKETEQNESFIANKYDLIVMPLKIDEVTKKIELVDDLLNKKKMFAKKENFESDFSKIEEVSPLRKVVSFEQFLNNEINRIDEKYAMIPELDLRTTADFFVDFDNLNINVPKMIGSKKGIQYEEVMVDLEKKYEIRPGDEKNILLLYNSIFYKLKHYLKYCDQPSVLFSINELYDILKNDNNVLFKIRYLNYLDTYNVEGFIASLIKAFDSINTIEKDKLLGSINVFFQAGKELSNLDYLLGSNKVSLAPSQYNGENSITYIASVDEGVPVLFVPLELTTDYVADDNLKVINNKPLLIFDMKDLMVKKEKSDIIKVTRFEMIFSNKEDYCIVKELRNKKIDLYQYIRIERKSL